MEKRKIPDIALHITNLSKELSELNQKLIKCKEEEKKCITEKNDIEKNIVENNQRSDTKEKSIKEETLGEIERLKHENEKSREEIKKIMEEIKQLNDNLQQKEKSYQEKAELYKQVAKIIVYTGYNDSSTVKDFQITKERWEQQHSLDKISIDNNKLEEKFSIFSDNQKKKEELQNSLEDNFMCPISYEIMRDPVMLLETGITYERKKIEEWLSTHNTCPKTQMELKSKALKPNIALKRSIEDWQEMKMKQQLLNNVPPKILITLQAFKLVALQYYNVSRFLLAAATEYIFYIHHNSACRFFALLCPMHYCTQNVQHRFALILIFQIHILQLRALLRPCNHYAKKANLANNPTCQWIFVGQLSSQSHQLIHR